MDSFVQVTGFAAPMLQANIDTDQIAPGRSILKLQKAGSANLLFANLRFKPNGDEDPDFVLNKPPYRKARFIVAGPNFGCGSSREIAAWALRDFGIRAIIAPSFGQIFASNCYINGILPITLPDASLKAIHIEQSSFAGEMTIDLTRQEIITSDKRTFTFVIPPLQREMLLSGLDAIELTLIHKDKIAAFQSTDARRRPWIYQETPHA